MCGIRQARAWHPEEDDTGWIRLQRPHITLSGIRLLNILDTILGLGVLLGEVNQGLQGPPPMMRTVFDDGLLRSAFTATGTLLIRGLGGLPLLVPSEVLGAGPAPVPAILPLGGPRPLDIDFGTSCPELTRVRGRTPHPLSTNAKPDVGTQLCH